LGVSVPNFTQLGCHADFYILLFEVVMRFLTADQEQQNVNLCEELRQIATDDATLPKVITEDKSLIYGYDPETKQQSC
jgi:hypothetical protein